jgi:UDP-glucose 4-epimerase
VRFLVTGAAGFIGSNLVDRLLSDGHHVVGYDNFSTGQQMFVEAALASPNYRQVMGDVLDRDVLEPAVEEADFVFHLAANADVRFGTEHPRKDLEQNTIATWNVLEVMRRKGTRRIAFASTGSVYGEPDVFPTPETCPFPVQTSLYGASKLAAEGLIQAYAEGFGIEATIFRFVSILGPRYSHGHVFDFYRQLLAHPGELRVLGNGKQRKSYLHVRDCIDAMLLAIEQDSEKVSIYNLGTDEYCEVNDSIRWITGHLGLGPKLIFTGGERGWVGDSPLIFLDCSRVRALGWQPKMTIREAVIETVDYLSEHQELLDLRC